MATPNEIFARQVGREVAEAIAHQSERKRPGQDRTPRAFSRVHPSDVQNPAAPTVELGAALGCLRYMRRTAPGHQVNCPPGYSLTLDPRFTAPNASVAVSFQGGGAWNEYAIMHPGDTLEVPEGFTRFWCFNADQLDQFVDAVNQPANLNLGYCSFLVGHVPGALPTFADLTPEGPAALIQHGILRTPDPNIRANNPALWFSPGALRAVRVTISARNAAGIDLGGSARVYTSVATLFLSRNLQTAAAPIFPPDTQTIEAGPFIAGGNNLTRHEVQGWSSFGYLSLKHALVFEVPRGQLACQVTQTLAFRDWFALALAAGGLATTDLYCYIEGIR